MSPRRSEHATAAGEPEPLDSAPEPRPPRPPRGRLRLALAGVGVLLLLTSPLWGPLLMRRLAFFRVRRIEIVGAKYVAPSDILARLAVDTTASVWDPFGPLERRVAGLTGIESVSMDRKLPGTLVVSVKERAPVALVPTANGFAVYDARGVALPIDPSRTPVDAPIAATRDGSIIRVLAALRTSAPAVYAQVSEVRRTGPDELLFDLGAVPVRTLQDVTVARLADIGPVVQDLQQRHLRAAELDLRYRDQVIARLQ